MRKLFVWFAVMALLLAGIGYLAASYVVYDTLSEIENGCWEREYGDNRPDSFTTPAGNNDGWPEDFDFSPYFMPSYETVSLPSRDNAITISGWYVPGEDNAPAVIVTHGLGTCKYSPNVLTPAGVLHNAGYHVLLIDVRDAGDSTLEDGRSSMGSEEHRDVLGAWDWLIAEKGFSPDQIGLMGNSMGAGTTLIAFIQEPRVAAVFVDSPFADLSLAIEGELAGNGYPTSLAPGGILMARLVAGDNVVAYEPLDAVRQAGDRPIMVAHSRADQRLSVRHAELLAEVGAEVGADVSLWIVDDAEHARLLGRYPDVYAEKLVSFFDGALRN